MYRSISALPPANKRRYARRIYGKNLTYFFSPATAPISIKNNSFVQFLKKNNLKLKKS